MGRVYVDSHTKFAGKFSNPKLAGKRSDWADFHSQILLGLIIGAILRWKTTNSVDFGNEFLCKESTQKIGNSVCVLQENATITVNVLVQL